MNQSPSQRVREQIATQGVDPTTHTGSGICTTVEITPDDGSPSWIQLHEGMINFRHHDSPEKDNLLGSIIDEFPVPDDADLTPGEFMTFNISDFSSEQLDGLIDRLVHEYFAIPSSGDISCSSEAL